MDDRGTGLRFLIGADIFHFSQLPDRVWSPSTLVSIGYGWESLGLKRPVCDGDHPPPSYAEVKNARSSTYTPLFVFMA